MGVYLTTFFTVLCVTIMFEALHLRCFLGDLLVHSWNGMNPVEPLWNFGKVCHVDSEYVFHRRDQQEMDLRVDGTHLEYTQDRLGILQFMHRTGEAACVACNQLAVNSVLVRSDDDLYAANHHRCLLVCRQVNGAQAVQVTQNRLQSIRVVIMQGDIRSARLLESRD
jgi:hypothetical protein